MKHDARNSDAVKAKARYIRAYFTKDYGETLRCLHSLFEIGFSDEEINKLNDYLLDTFESYKEQKDASAGCYSENQTDTAP